MNSLIFPKLLIIFFLFKYYKMRQFDLDYIVGKKSEEDSHLDLNRIFKTELIHDKEQFAHFDFSDGNIFVELKTRQNTKFNGEYFIHTKKDGSTCILNTLYFDVPKKWFAYKYKDSDKKFFIVWKCAGEYFYWQINHDKKDYYIENQFGDYGKGFNQEKNVVNVKLHALTRVN